MKRTLLFLGALMMMSVTLFVSCSEDTTTTDLPPSISFVAGAGYIATDATVTVNSPFVVKVLTEQNATSGAKLQSLNVTRIFNNQTVGDTTFAINSNDASVTQDVNFISYPQAGVENIEFEVVDKDGQKAKKILKITTEEASDEVQKWANITLGSYNDPIGSFFATTTGKVMTIDEGTANPAIVDFAFFLGATNGSSIASPIDDILLEFIDFAPVENWNPRNDTRLIYPAPINSNDFNSIGTSYSFPAFNTASSVTLANQLAVNDVIYFQTAAGKLGFIKINSINGRGDKANIDVIVEK
jgi:hypothetical protein